MRWDIFCHVIDNYGDIGICWRLACQLTAEFGLSVRLLVDDLGSMQRICPEINRDLAAQHAHGVEIVRWIEPFPDLEPADVVIEAFGCELPPRYVAAMATVSPRCVWINLEYLSAEQWVEGYHGLASPHPGLPLIKYFFFPGFSAATGGVIRESGLLARRDVSQINRTELWQELGMACPAPDETVVSLFCYDSAPIKDLLNAWAGSISPVRCLLPEGVASAQIAKWAGKSGLIAGNVPVQHGNLTLQVIPFLPQENYDHLLWACDCNFVRGEDSFVRAQWAGRPLIWQIYPQQENAHLPKLEAFVDLYCQGMTMEAAEVMRSFHLCWNNQCQLNWDDFWQHRKELQHHAMAWSGKLARIPDLASNLVNFCRSRQ